MPDKIPTSANQPFVFVDPASARQFALACKFGETALPVLITGPTGAGKEIMARVIHESSPRARGPFIAINCSAITPSLAEDLLFGHEKGAFTGAHSPMPGCFEQADGGTLFLDEIGDMPLDLQPKLLRLLQERKLTRLGGTREMKIDIRIVAATNANLRDEIRQGRFREDLYYRLSTFALRLPRLAERQRDIKPLALLMLQKHAGGRPMPQLADDALARLLAYPWPGNVRELENVMARAMLMCDGITVTAADLAFDDEGDQPQGNPSVQESCVEAYPPASLQSTVRRLEQNRILETVRSARCREEAALLLGISERTLRQKLQQMRQEGLAVPKVYQR
ncbi:MAG: Nif-specific regulatory protein [Pseudomonadota bacterium]